METVILQQPLDRQICVDLEQELSASPAYISTQHADQIKQILQSVKSRLAELDELERCTKVAAWERPYLDLANIEQLDRHAAVELLLGLQSPTRAFGFWSDPGIS